MFELDRISVDEIKKGFVLSDANAYVCIHCGKAFDIAEIFKLDERFFCAEKAVVLHMECEHPDRFQDLIYSKQLSLTDNQKELFMHFNNGLNDNEIAKTLGVAASTIRHQRFVFRERAKTAKLYLAAWETIEENKSRQASLLPIHKGATMVDERYEITEEENQKILESMFLSLEPLKLKLFSPKEKKKIVILRKIAEQFEPGREYTEKQVNTVLEAIYSDYATLRRYLIEYGYMDRTKDCRNYWRK